MGSATSCYYITLVAIDPATQLPQTFQTRVNELRYGELVLDCCIARPLGNFIYFFSIQQVYHIADFDLL